MTELLRGLIDAHQREHGTASEGSGLLQQIKDGQNITDRRNFNGHVTASALVLQQSSKKVLFFVSRKSRRLLLPGGHCEEAEAPIEAAVRELHEEAGISPEMLDLMPPGDPKLLEINTHKIHARPEKNELEHLHHDFVYAFALLHDRVNIVLDKREAVEFKWLPASQLAASYPMSLARLEMKGFRL